MATNTNDGGFTDGFDSVDQSFWYLSDFTMGADWINTAWEADNVTQSGGEITLELNTDDRDGKEYTGAEIQSNEFYGYGTYTVRMQASGEAGVNSNFFTYTGEYFGDEWNEIDFEFLGSDPSKVWVTYHTGAGSYEGAYLDLGFDASAAMHEYSFVWEPNSISWYVDGVLLHEVVNPELAVPDTPSKLYMNIWTGSPEWLGEPEFEGSTTAVYDEVTFTPWDGNYTHALPGETDPGETDFGPLVAMDDTAATDSGQAVSIDVLANDTDAEGDPLSIELSTTVSSEGGSLAVMDGKVLYTPEEGFSGTDTFLYTAYDNNGESGTATVTVEVAEPPAPEPPAASDIELFLVEARTGTFVTRVNDGDQIDFDLVSRGSHNLVARLADGALANAQLFDFKLTGAINYSGRDKSEPFAVFGDKRGSLGGEEFKAGSYTLDIEVYEHKSGRGAPTITDTIEFDILI